MAPEFESEQNHQSDREVREGDEYISVLSEGMELAHVAVQRFQRDEPIALYAGGSASFVQRGTDRRSAAVPDPPTITRTGERIP